MAWVVTVQVLVALLHFTLLYSLLLIASLLYYDLPRLGVPPERFCVPYLWLRIFSMYLNHEKLVRIVIWGFVSSCG